MSDRIGFNRRTLLGALALALPVTGAGAAFAQTAVDHDEIEVSGRKVRLFVWKAAKPRGAVVFLHGAGGSPEAYGKLLDRWCAAGISVVAPLHVDSQLHPDHDSYTLQRAFMPRLADTKASVAYAQKAFPDLKVGAAGHSYGSLFAEIAAGGLSPMFGQPKAPVAAVVAFSSPGKIASLVHPDSFATMNVPLLSLTGDRDVVEGAVADWHDHLYAYETSPPGDKYAWVGKGVDHLYGGALDRARSDGTQVAQYEEAAALSTQFLQAYLEGDAAARSALASRTDTPLAHFARR